jgi:prolipoprotein diacylglyceryl transferase
MNNVAFKLGPLTIYWYSVLILLAFALGYYLVMREFKKHKLSLSFLNDYFFYTIPIVILGARIYYVIFEWEYYSNNLSEIFATWNGGLAIHGGIIAGIIFTIFYTKKHKIDALKLLDIASPALIVGQALGRWGNFFNQEAYGPATTLAHLKSLPIPNFVIEGMKINDVYYEPTFFYESLACLLGFIIILIIRRCKKIKVGQVTSLYFMIYGITRLFIEGLRQDSLMLGDIKVAQLVSIIMILAGIGLFIKQHFSKNLYNKEK